MALSSHAREYQEWQAVRSFCEMEEDWHVFLANLDEALAARRRGHLELFYIILDAVKDAVNFQDA